MRRKKKQHFSVYLITAGAIFLSAILLLGGLTQFKNARQPAAVIAPSIPKEYLNSQPTPTASPFENLSLEARAAYVYDVERGSGVYSADAETPYPLASLTKIMTAYTAAEHLPESAPIMITEAAYNTEGESGFLPYEYYSRQDLIDATLISSSNDAARALSDTRGDFVQKMNEGALALGATQASFLNATGLDINNETVASAEASAKDVAVILANAFKEHPEIFRRSTLPEVVVTSEAGRSHVQENTSDLVYSLPGTLVSKTGYTIQAGGNLAMLFNVGPARPVAIIILGSSYDGRFVDMEKLYTATVEHFAQ